MDPSSQHCTPNPAVRKSSGEFHSTPGRPDPLGGYAEPQGFVGTKMVVERTPEGTVLADSIEDWHSPTPIPMRPKQETPSQATSAAAIFDEIHASPSPQPPAKSTDV